MKRFLGLALAMTVLTACQMHDEDYVLISAEEIRRVPDGVYVGEIREKLDNAKVEVTISNGTITAFEILEVLAYDWREEPVKAEIPARILEAQSLDIDAVTGATGSTHAVLVAASEALYPALEQ